MSLPLTCLHLGTWPAAQACALTGIQTGNPLVCRPVLNPLSHTSQGHSQYNFLLLSSVQYILYKMFPLIFPVTQLAQYIIITPFYGLLRQRSAWVYICMSLFLGFLFYSNRNFFQWKMLQPYCVLIQKKRCWH